MKYKYYLLSFFIIGFIVYFPKFFNNFVWDDIIYILENTQIHNLNFSIFYDNVFNSGPFYRQFTVFYYSLLYTLFGASAFPYHLIQLILHIVVTSIIFLIFNYYFNTKISFPLALLFLIHPINAETVLWIGSVQVQLFTIPGLMALLIVHKKRLTERDLFIIFMCLFLSILSYEMGVFFFVLILVYVIYYKPSLKKQMFFTLLGILGIYFFLRFSNNGLVFKILHDQEGIQATILQTIFTIPSIILYYLKTLLFPYHLMIFQGWLIKEFSLQQVLLPFSVVLLMIFFYIKLFLSSKKNRKTLLFFSVWFIIGMASLIHIFPVEMTVSDRWFYFTFIGLLGMIGYIFQTYAAKFYRYKVILFAILILLFCFYSVRTFYRTFDWKDNITLFTHDLQHQKDNLNIIYNLGTYYEEKGEYQQATAYYEKVAITTPTYPYALMNAAIMNEKIQSYDKALTYYKKAKVLNVIPPVTAINIDLAITRLLRQNNNNTEIIKFITDQSIADSSQPYVLLFVRAEAYYKTRNYEKAMKDAEHLHSSVKDPIAERLYNDVKAALEENN